MKYRVDLHCHTNHSHDCQTTVRQLLVAAQKAGLSAIAITDHDQTGAVSQAKALAPRYGIQVIPGVEITTEGGTHVVALFLEKYPTNLHLEAVLDFIKAEGGISILPHLYRSDTGLLYNHKVKGQFTDKEVTTILQKVDAIEAINFKSQLRGEDIPKETIATYQKPLVASTDAHYAFEVGKCSTTFELPEGQELTKEHLLNATRALVYYPLTKAKKPTKQVPLAHYQPSVTSVSKLKKVIPAPVIRGIGKGFYRWQEYGTKVEKARKLEHALQGLTQVTITPEALMTAS